MRALVACAVLAVAVACDTSPSEGEGEGEGEGEAIGQCLVACSGDDLVGFWDPCTVDEDGENCAEAVSCEACAAELAQAQNEDRCDTDGVAASEIICDQ